MIAQQAQHIAMLCTAAGIIVLSMTLATAAARAGQGSGTVAAIERCAALGCTIHLTKPIEHNQFVQAIRH